MLPSLANLRCDTETPVRRREGPDVETNSPKRARKERKTPILVDGEWVRHYRHAPLDDASIRRAVEALTNAPAYPAESDPTESGLNATSIDINTKKRKNLDLVAPIYLIMF